MEEWNEIQYTGRDSNDQDQLLDLLSDNSCYSLDKGTIIIEKQTR